MDRNGAPLLIGRYAIYDEVAAGGMATVHYGRLLGPVGFSRTVAVKRLHPTYSRDPEFVAMFLDEARLCGRVRHPNVVSMLDVVATRGELFLVMDYVLGDSLARLCRAARRAGKPIPLPIVSSIVSGVLHGLHAAHEARGERGEPLEIVHRDVSPQNVLVGLDGLARVVDFGVAKATGRLQSSRDGQIKGKIAYMAPEQLRAVPVDRRTDIYAASVVLWETLCGRHLFDGESEGALMGKILEERVPPPSEIAPGLTPELDELVLRGLSRRRERRFATAREMALALETCVRPALPSEVSAWVESVAGEVIGKRAHRIAEIENASSRDASDAASAMELAGPAEDRTPSVISVPATEASQMSSISVTIDEARPRARRLLPAALFALFALVGVAAVAGALLWGRREPERATTTASSAPSVPAAPNTSSASANATVASVVEPSASATATAVVPSSPRPAVHKVVKAPAATSKPAVKPPPGAAGKPANCYRVDATGIWHIKPECL